MPPMHHKDCIAQQKYMKSHFSISVTGQSEAEDHNSSKPVGNRPINLWTHQGSNTYSIPLEYKEGESDAIGTYELCAI